MAIVRVGQQLNAGHCGHPEVGEDQRDLTFFLTPAL
jgi:hypothetical protein